MHLYNPSEQATHESQDDLLRHYAESVDENVRNGIAATLIAVNMPSIIKIARRYSGAMQLEDLVQEAALELVRKAIPLFDRSKGVAFMTYARRHIRHALLRATDNQYRTIRVPVHQLDKARAARKRGIMTGPIIPSTVLLQTPIGNAGSGPVLEDLIPDTRYMPDVPTTQREHEALVERVVATLKPREQAIIRYRFGLTWPDGSTEALTLEEIGTRYNVSRQRIGKLEERALKEMRHTLGHMGYMPHDLT